VDLNLLLQLVETYANKPGLDADERHLYQVLKTYLALQMRAGTLQLKKVLIAEGFTNDDLEGFTAEG